jgi:hypothetical protein
MDTTKYKQKSMGIVLKRRDNAQIVKKIYGGVINIILEKQDLEGSIEFLLEELSNLVEGKTPIKDLIITKSLRGSYKDPSKIAHKVLADRIGARDPGNRPVVNERIPFVYIKTDKSGSGAASKTAPSLQGDRIEHPDYIEQNNLIPDYLHYITNQIMKPVLQLYALCLERLPGYDKSDEYWDDVEKGLLDKPLYQNETRRKNRIGNLKLMMVKELLFDRFINILQEPKAPRAKAKTATVAKTAKSKDTGAAGAASGTAGAASGTEVSVVKTKKPKKAKPAGDDISEASATSTIASATSTIASATSTNLDATIKITKKLKTNMLEAIAYIKNDKNKKVWEVKKENCKNKDCETIELVKQITSFDSNNIYYITLNNKGFVDEYNRAHYSYNELIKSNLLNSENTIEKLMKNIMNSHDTGKLKDINNVYKYYDLILLNSKFMFV